MTRRHVRAVRAARRARIRARAHPTRPSPPPPSLLASLSSQTAWTLPEPSAEPAALSPVGSGASASAPGSKNPYLPFEPWTWPLIFDVP